MARMVVWAPNTVCVCAGDVAAGAYGGAGGGASGEGKAGAGANEAAGVVASAIGMRQAASVPMMAAA